MERPWASHTTIAKIFTSAVKQKIKGKCSDLALLLMKVISPLGSAYDCYHLLVSQFLYLDRISVALLGIDQLIRF